MALHGMPCPVVMGPRSTGNSRLECCTYVPVPVHHDAAAAVTSGECAPIWPYYSTIVCPCISVSVYYKMKKAYQCSLKCGTLGGRCGYIVERELSTMSTHPLDKESIQ